MLKGFSIFAGSVAISWGLSISQVNASEAWKNYCSDGADALFYSAKLRDLGKTQEDVMKRVKAPKLPSGESPYEAPFEEMQRQVFKRASHSPQVFYDAWLNSCLSSDRNL